MTMVRGGSPAGLPDQPIARRPAGPPAGPPDLAGRSVCVYNQHCPSGFTQIDSNAPLSLSIYLSLTLSLSLSLYISLSLTLSLSLSLSLISTVEKRASEREPPSRFVSNNNNGASALFSSVNDKGAVVRTTVRLVCRRPSDPPVRPTAATRPLRRRIFLVSTPEVEGGRKRKRPPDGGVIEC